MAAIGTAAPAPAEQGYVERAVLWVRDIVVDLFNRIYECVRRALGYSAPAPVVDPKEKIRQFQVRLRDEVNPIGPIALMRAFKEYCNEDEQKMIYEQAAQDVRIWPGQTRAAYGEEKVRLNPRQLIPYLQEAIQLELSK